MLARLPWVHKPEANAGQRKFKFNRQQRERLIGLVADILRGGEPTPFRFEAVCRHALRTWLCLRGQAWWLSDALATDLVCSALDRIGAKRPPWDWGQREYVMDSSATRIAFTHCLNCGMRLDEERTKFCSKECGGRYRSEFEKSVEAQAAARVYSAAARESYRNNAEAIRCEGCKRGFKPSYPEQRFCSRECSGRRSIAEKSNGKYQAWLNGKTGDNDANGAEDCSLPTPTSGNGTAIGNARNESISPLSAASALPPASG